jgi:hypothetical protein
MKSGDKFLHNKSGVIYTLQKLPDFDLWILIGDAGGILTHWIGPTRHYGPIDEAIKAFEGQDYDFTLYEEKVQQEELVTPSSNNTAGAVVQERIVRLLNRWRDEIAGWEEAANIAARGNESGVASRNRVRAHSIRGCVNDLMEICETNSNLSGTI